MTQHPMLEHAPTAYCVVGSDGTVLHCNQACRELFVMPPREGSNFLDFFLDESKDGASQLYRMLRQQHAAGMEFRLKGGSPPSYVRLYAWSQPRAAGALAVDTHVLLFNVSEDHQFRVALRESEARFRVLGDSAPVMLWLADRDSRCSFFNQPWLDFTGRSLAEELGEGWAMGIHAEDFARAMDTYLEAFVSRRPFRMEYRLRRHDGVYRWILDTGVPRSYPDGKFAGFVGSCIDVSDLKETHAALQELTSRLEERVKERTASLQASNRELQKRETLLAQAHTLAAIGSFEWEVDENGAAHQVWSAELLRILRVDGECDSFTLNTFLDRLDANDRPRVRDAILLAWQSGEPYTLEASTLQGPDGVRVLRILGHVDTDALGKPLRLLCTCQDVTESKKTESMRVRLAHERAARDAAEAAQRRSIFLAESSSVLAQSLDYRDTLAAAVQLPLPLLAECCSIHTFDDDGTAKDVVVGHVNPALCEPLEACLRRLSPASCSWFSREFMFSDVLDELALRGVEADLVATVRDCQLRVVFGVPMVARQRVFGVICFWTSALSTDEHWTSLARDLGHRVAVAVDNAALYEASLRAVRARDEFLSVASHELRTPLSALVMQTASLDLLLRRRLGENEGDKLIAKAKSAARSTERLTRLIDSMLDLSRVASGNLDVHFETCQVDDLVLEVCERLSEEATKAGCKVSITCPAIKVCWDKMRIEQVLSNLLSNAFKYGSANPVEVHVCEQGDCAEISVRDQGIGIDPADLERVFHRFERAVPVKNYGGLGLGLFISRQIVEAHGGRIFVRSQKGVETVFTVRLPLNAGDSEKSRADQGAGDKIETRSP